MADPYLVLSKVGKRYGDQTVIAGLDLAMAAGEFISLLGPSGCGKTTLLRMIAGLIGCDAGSITVAGTDLTRVPAHQRNIGVVFQNYALFPHLNVGENVAFGLKARRLPAAEIEAAVVHALGLVQLAEYRQRPIGALSGGQQQRVALARAIATQPRVLLLDESLSALDRKLRETMQIELRRILRAAGITAIFVTHDQEEALVMSDRIAVMNAGRIEQLDTPAAIYARPATPFVMDFVGLSCRIAGEVEASSAGRSTVRTPYGAITGMGGFRPGARVTVGMRPERLRVGAGQAGDNQLGVRAADPVYLGSRQLIYFDSQGGDRLLAELPGDGGHAPAVGETAQLSWPVADTFVFPAAAA